MKQIIVTALSFLALTGCSSHTEADLTASLNNNLLSSVDMDRYTRVDDAQAVLAETAVSVSNSLNKLARVEQAANSTKIDRGWKQAPLTRQMPGLGRLVNVDFTDLAEDDIIHLAKAAHYKFRVLGKRPTIPAMVSIHAKNVPIGDVIRDIGYQIRHQARIVVDPKKRVIELRYESP